MDHYGKDTSSITDNLKELPTLSQLSDVNFENHQVKMNDSNGSDLEQSFGITKNRLDRYWFWFYFDWDNHQCS